MTFIGICANQKEFEVIKSRINKQIGENELNIIPIYDNNIQNLQNIRFDTFIIHQEMTINKNLNILKKICENVHYILINSDKNVKLDILKDNRNTIITYGLNHKCTVTASSIREDYIMVALQRGILNKNGDLQEIEEQPIKVIDNLDVYGHMLLFILTILYKKR